MTTFRVSILDKSEWQESVLDKDLTFPPALPQKGYRYLISGVGSGSWIGQDGNIAEYDGIGWIFVRKKVGMVIYVKDEEQYYVYKTSWVIFPSATKVRVYQSIPQSISALTYTKVNLQTKVFDLLNEFNTLDSRFIARQSKFYYVDGSIYVNSSSTLASYLYIYVNGILDTASYFYGDYANPKVSNLVYLESGNYIELFCYLYKSKSLYALPSITFLSIIGL